MVGGNVKIKEKKEQWPVNLRATHVLWIDRRFMSKSVAMRAMVDFAREREKEFDAWVKEWKDE